jgi:hypothetical protein
VNAATLVRVNDDVIARVRCSACGTQVDCNEYRHDGDTPNRYLYSHVCIVELTADEIAKLERAE